MQAMPQSSGMRRRRESSPARAPAELLLLGPAACVPPGFVCCLSGALLDDPVIDPDDPEVRPVERAAMEEHQQRHGARPLSGLPALPAHLLRTCAQLQSCVAAFLQCNARRAAVIGTGPSTGAAHPHPAKAPRLLQKADEREGEGEEEEAPAPVAVVPLREVPGSFFCPLSRRLLRDPVIDRHYPDVAWERSALEAHVGEHSTNPLTGSPLQVRDLRPFPAIASAISAWTSSNATTQRLFTAAPPLQPQLQELPLKPLPAVAAQPAEFTTDAASPAATSIQPPAKRGLVRLQEGEEEKEEGTAQQRKQPRLVTPVPGAGGGSGGRGPGSAAVAAAAQGATHAPPAVHVGAAEDGEGTALQSPSQQPQQQEPAATTSLRATVCIAEGLGAAVAAAAAAVPGRPVCTPAAGTGSPASAVVATIRPSRILHFTPPPPLGAPRPQPSLAARAALFGRAGPGSGPAGGAPRRVLWRPGPAGAAVLAQLLGTARAASGRVVGERSHPQPAPTAELRAHSCVDGEAAETDGLVAAGSVPAAAAVVGPTITSSGAGDAPLLGRPLQTPARCPQGQHGIQERPQEQSPQQRGVQEDRGRELRRQVSSRSSGGEAPPFQVPPSAAHRPSRRAQLRANGSNTSRGGGASPDGGMCVDADADDGWRSRGGGEDSSCDGDGAHPNTHNPTTGDSGPPSSQNSDSGSGGGSQQQRPVPPQTGAGGDRAAGTPACVEVEEDGGGEGCARGSFTREEALVAAVEAHGCRWGRIARTCPELRGRAPGLKPRWIPRKKPTLYLSIAQARDWFDGGDEGRCLPAQVQVELDGVLLPEAHAAELRWYSGNSVKVLSSSLRRVAGNTWCLGWRCDQQQQQQLEGGGAFGAANNAEAAGGSDEAAGALGCVLVLMLSSAPAPREDVSEGEAGMVGLEEHVSPSVSPSGVAGGGSAAAAGAGIGVRRVGGRNSGGAARPPGTMRRIPVAATPLQAAPSYELQPLRHTRMHASGRGKSSDGAGGGGAGADDADGWGAGVEPSSEDDAGAHRDTDDPTASEGGSGKKQRRGRRPGKASGKKGERRPRGSFTQEEAEALVEAVEAHGCQWTHIVRICPELRRRRVEALCRQWWKWRHGAAAGWQQAQQQHGGQLPPVHLRARIAALLSASGAAAAASAGPTSKRKCLKHLSPTKGLSSPRLLPCARKVVLNLSAAQARDWFGGPGCRTQAEVQVELEGSLLPQCHAAEVSWLAYGTVRILSSSLRQAAAGKWLMGWRFDRQQQRPPQSGVMSGGDGDAAGAAGATGGASAAGVAAICASGAAAVTTGNNSSRAEGAAAGGSDNDGMLVLLLRSSSTEVARRSGGGDSGDDGDDPGDEEGERDDGDQGDEGGDGAVARPEEAAAVAGTVEAAATEEVAAQGLVSAQQEVRADVGDGPTVETVAAAAEVTAVEAAAPRAGAPAAELEGFDTAAGQTVSAAVDMAVRQGDREALQGARQEEPQERQEGMLGRPQEQGQPVQVKEEQREGPQQQEHAQRGGWRRVTSPSWTGWAGSSGSRHVVVDPGVGATGRAASSGAAGVAGTAGGGPTAPTAAAHLTVQTAVRRPHQAQPLLRVSPSLPPLNALPASIPTGPGPVPSLMQACGPELTSAAPVPAPNGGRVRGPSVSPEPAEAPAAGGAVLATLPGGVRAATPPPTMPPSPLAAVPSPLTLTLPVMPDLAAGYGGGVQAVTGPALQWPLLTQSPFHGGALPNGALPNGALPQLLMPPLTPRHCNSAKPSLLPPPPPPPSRLTTAHGLGLLDVAAGYGGCSDPDVDGGEGHALFQEVAAAMARATDEVAASLGNRLAAQQRQEGQQQEAPPLPTSAAAVATAPAAPADGIRPHDYSPHPAPRSLETLQLQQGVAPRSLGPLQLQRRQVPQQLPSAAATLQQPLPVPNMLATAHGSTLPELAAAASRRPGGADGAASLPQNQQALPSCTASPGMSLPPAPTAAGTAPAPVPAATGQGIAELVGGRRQQDGVTRSTTHLHAGTGNLDAAVDNNGALSLSKRRWLPRNKMSLYLRAAQYREWFGGSDQGLYLQVQVDLDGALLPELHAAELRWHVNDQKIVVSSSLRQAAADKWFLGWRFEQRQRPQQGPTGSGDRRAPGAVESGKVGVVTAAPDSAVSDWGVLVLMLGSGPPPTTSAIGFGGLHQPTGDEEQEGGEGEREGGGGGGNRSAATQRHTSRVYPLSPVHRHLSHRWLRRSRALLYLSAAQVRDWFGGPGRCTQAQVQVELDGVLSPQVHTAQLRKSAASRSKARKAITWTSTHVVSSSLRQAAMEKWFLAWRYERMPQTLQQQQQQQQRSLGSSGGSGASRAEEEEEAGEADSSLAASAGCGVLVLVLGSGPPPTTSTAVPGVLRQPMDDGELEGEEGEGGGGSSGSGPPTTSAAAAAAVDDVMGAATAPAAVGHVALHAVVPRAYYSAQQEQQGSEEEGPGQRQQPWQARKPRDWRAANARKVINREAMFEDSGAMPAEDGTATAGEEALAMAAAAAAQSSEGLLATGEQQTRLLPEPQRMPSGAAAAALPVSATPAASAAADAASQLSFRSGWQQLAEIQRRLSHSRQQQQEQRGRIEALVVAEVATPVKCGGSNDDDDADYDPREPSAGKQVGKRRRRPRPEPAAKGKQQQMPRGGEGRGCAAGSPAAGAGLTAVPAWPPQAHSLQQQQQQQMQQQMLLQQMQQQMQLLYSYQQSQVPQPLQVIGGAHAAAAAAGASDAAAGSGGGTGDRSSSSGDDDDDDGPVQSSGRRQHTLCRRGLRRDAADQNGQQQQQQWNSGDGGGALGVLHGAGGTLPERLLMAPVRVELDGWLLPDVHWVRFQGDDSGVEGAGGGGGTHVVLNECPTLRSVLTSRRRAVGWARVGCGGDLVLRLVTDRRY